MQQSRLQSQRGVILFSSLAILSVLVSVGIAIRIMLLNDYRVLTNLRGGTEAFYYSVAGLEWGKNELAGATTFPPAPANQRKSFASGEFAVSFVSPATIGPLSARVVVRSVGTIGAASHTLQAGLIKAYDLADAAIGLRGNVSRVSFGEYPILISGLDHDAATGNPLPGAPSRSVISTADEAAQALISAALGDPLRDILENGADTPAMSLSGHLSSSTVSQLSSSLCTSSGVLTTTIPDGGALSVQDQTWGDRDAPQLRCVQGLQSSGDSISLSGTVTGAGILIIKDADLIVSGALRWEGLIIITGGEVSLKITGSGGKEILGALIVNEAGIPGNDSRILDIQGNLRLLFSRQALSRAAGLIPSAVLNNTYAALPPLISQQYWRAVNP